MTGFYPLHAVREIEASLIRAIREGSVVVACDRVALRSVCAMNESATSRVLVGLDGAEGRRATMGLLLNRRKCESSMEGG